MNPHRPTDGGIILRSVAQAKGRRLACALATTRAANRQRALSLTSTPAQSEEREGAAFTLVVDSQHERRVLDADDEKMSAHTISERMPSMFSAPAA
jgi:hypothetical protein